MTTIPTTLAPFFQEYDFKSLNPVKDSHTIIERVLQFGNHIEIRWLFDTYSEKEIVNWVRRFAADKLPQPHRTFWQVVLDISK